VYISISLTGKTTHSLPSSAFVMVVMAMLGFLRVLFLPFIPLLFFSQTSFSFPSCSVVQSSIPFRPTFPYTNDHQETWTSKTKAFLGLVLDVPIFLPNVYQD
jgi:hypothetical protein